AAVYGKGFVASTQESAAQETSTNAIKPRLLAVEDDEDILAIFESGLSEDFEIVTANDGIEAIERIVKFEPDLIVIDALMPRMSGFQLLQSLRRNHRFARTPIII